jgi:hypothetical protein
LDLQLHEAERNIHGSATLILRIYSLAEPEESTYGSATLVLRTYSSTKPEEILAAPQHWFFGFTASQSRKKYLRLRNTGFSDLQLHEA